MAESPPPIGLLEALQEGGPTKMSELPFSAEIIVYPNAQPVSKLKTGLASLAKPGQAVILRQIDPMYRHAPDSALGTWFIDNSADKDALIKHIKATHGPMARGHAFPAPPTFGGRSVSAVVGPSAEGFVQIINRIDGGFEHVAAERVVIVLDVDDLDGLVPLLEEVLAYLRTTTGGKIKAVYVLVVSDSRAKNQKSVHASEKISQSQVLAAGLKSKWDPSLRCLRFPVSRFAKPVREGHVTVLEVYEGRRRIAPLMLTDDEVAEALRSMDMDMVVRMRPSKTAAGHGGVVDIDDSDDDDDVELVPRGPQVGQKRAEPIMATLDPVFKRRRLDVEPAPAPVPGRVAVPVPAPAPVPSLLSAAVAVPAAIVAPAVDPLARALAAPAPVSPFSAPPTQPPASAPVAVGKSRGGRRVDIISTNTAVESTTRDAQLLVSSLSKLGTRMAICRGKFQEALDILDPEDEMNISDYGDDDDDDGPPKPESEPHSMESIVSFVRPSREGMSHAVSQFMSHDTGVAETDSIVDEADQVLAKMVGLLDSTQQGARPISDSDRTAISEAIASIMRVYPTIAHVVMTTVPDPLSTPTCTMVNPPSVVPAGQNAGKRIPGTNHVVAPAEFFASYPAGGDVGDAVETVLETLREATLSDTGYAFAAVSIDFATGDVAVENLLPLYEAAARYTVPYFERRLVDVPEARQIAEKTTGAQEEVSFVMCSNLWEIRFVIGTITGLVAGTFLGLVNHLRAAISADDEDLDLPESEFEDLPNIARVPGFNQDNVAVFFVVEDFKDLIAVPDDSEDGSGDDDLSEMQQMTEAFTLRFDVMRVVPGVPVEEAVLFHRRWARVVSAEQGRDARLDPLLDPSTSLTPPVLLDWSEESLDIDADEDEAVARRIAQSRGMTMGSRAAGAQEESESRNPRRSVFDAASETRRAEEFKERDLPGLLAAHPEIAEYVRTEPLKLVTPVDRNDVQLVSFDLSDASGVGSATVQKKSVPKDALSGLKFGVEQPPYAENAQITDLLATALPTDPDRVIDQRISRMTKAFETYVSLMLADPTKMPYIMIVDMPSPGAGDAGTMLVSFLKKLVAAAIDAVSTYTSSKVHFGTPNKALRILLRTPAEISAEDIVTKVFRPANASFFVAGTDIPKSDDIAPQLSKHSLSVGFTFVNMARTHARVARNKGDITVRDMATVKDWRRIEFPLDGLASLKRSSWKPTQSVVAFFGGDEVSFDAFYGAHPTGMEKYEFEYLNSLFRDVESGGNPGRCFVRAIPGKGSPNLNATTVAYLTPASGSAKYARAMSEFIQTISSGFPDVSSVVFYIDAQVAQIGEADPYVLVDAIVDHYNSAARVTFTKTYFLIPGQTAARTVTPTSKRPLFVDSANVNVKAGFLGVHTKDSLYRLRTWKKYAKASFVEAQSYTEIVEAGPDDTDPDFSRVVVVPATPLADDTKNNYWTSKSSIERRWWMALVEAGYVKPGMLSPTEVLAALPPTSGLFDGLGAFFGVGPASSGPSAPAQPVPALIDLDDDDSPAESPPVAQPSPVAEQKADKPKKPRPAPKPMSIDFRKNDFVLFPANDPDNRFRDPLILVPGFVNSDKDAETIQSRIEKMYKLVKQSGANVIVMPLLGGAWGSQLPTSIKATYRQLATAIAQDQSSRIIEIKTLVPSKALDSANSPKDSSLVDLAYKSAESSLSGASGTVPYHLSPLYMGSYEYGGAPLTDEHKDHLIRRMVARYGRIRDSLEFSMRRDQRAYMLLTEPSS